MSAVLLFFAPTIVFAQAVPATTSTGIESAAPTTTPASAATTPTPTTTASVLPVAMQSGVNSGPVYVPVQVPQVVYPIAQPGVYPVSAPTYSSVPTSSVPTQIANPGGLTVQVTTQIGIPNQGSYPVIAPAPVIPIGTGQVGYLGLQGAYPGMPTNQSGYPFIYPAGVYNPNSALLTPAQPSNTNRFVDANANPALLPWAAQTLWQQIISAPNPGNSQTISTLQQMLREYPNFIPAYIQLAQAFIANNRTQDAIATLERGIALYPNQPELARSLIVALGNSKRWNEAAMAARQFVIRNPNSPLVSEFTKLADESIKLAQAPSSNSSPARGSVLSNLLTTGLGYLLTGRGSSPIANTQAPWSSVFPSSNTTGNQMAQELLSQVQLLNDAEVSNYINDIGRRLAQAAGRSDFEFYVVKDRDSGAIALPNSKIFISAGSIANTNSEAELASLIARQIGHAVLSHPNKLAQRGTITNTLTRLLPAMGSLVSPKVRDFNNSPTGTLVSGLISNLSNRLLKPNYTSQMVNDATKTGSQLLETAGYRSGSLLNISLGSDRHTQMKIKVQQLLGTSQPWWSLGR